MITGKERTGINARTAVSMGRDLRRLSVTRTSRERNTRISGHDLVALAFVFAIAFIQAHLERRSRAG